jgi:hypothetical protein
LIPPDVKGFAAAHARLAMDLTLDPCFTKDFTYVTTPSRASWRTFVAQHKRSPAMRAVAS